MGTNQLVLHALNNFAGVHKWLDAMAYDIITYVPIIMCLGIAVIYFVGLAKKDQAMRMSAFHSFIFLVFSMIATFVIGHVYFERRPMFALKDVKAPYAHTNDSSFPSDHATITMSLTLSAYKASKILGILYFVLALVVCTAKIYLAEHYPLDIVGTFAVVILLRFIYLKWLSKYIERFYVSVESKLF